MDNLQVKITLNKMFCNRCAIFRKICEKNGKCNEWKKYFHKGFSEAFSQWLFALLLKWKRHRKYGMSVNFIGICAELN